MSGEKNKKPLHTLLYLDLRQWGPFRVSQDLSRLAAPGSD
jgi:hypothetical protein